MNLIKESTSVSKNYKKAKTYGLSQYDNGILPAHYYKKTDLFFRLSAKTDGPGIYLYIVKHKLQIL